MGRPAFPFVEPPRPTSGRDRAEPGTDGLHHASGRVASGGPIRPHRTISGSPWPCNASEVKPGLQGPVMASGSNSAPGAGQPAPLPVAFCGGERGWRLEDGAPHLQRRRKPFGAPGAPPPPPRGLEAQSVAVSRETTALPMAEPQASLLPATPRVPRLAPRDFARRSFADRPVKAAGRSRSALMIEENPAESDQHTGTTNQRGCTGVEVAPAAGITKGGTAG